MAPRREPFSSSIFCPCEFLGSAKMMASSPATTSRSSTAPGPRPTSTTCRSIAVLRICSFAASNKTPVGLPNKGQVFRKIGRRKLVPYYDRAEIEDGAIAGRGLEICWLKDQTDLLFTQIQGSARVRLEDGSTMRINYDAHNGYPYTPVGRILIDRGIIPKEQMSMQKIREWMDQNPDGAKELRRQNRSYVFFREVQLSDKDEAVGAQGVPLTPGPVDRGRQGAARLRHAVFHRGRAADRFGAIEDAVSPADDRAGHRLRDRRTGARRSLFRRRRRCREEYPAVFGTICVLSCWCRRASIRWRVAAGCRCPIQGRRRQSQSCFRKPILRRISKKIRRTARSRRRLRGCWRKGCSQDTEAAKKPAPAAPTSVAVGQAPSARTAAANPVPLPEARPNVKPSREARRARYIGRYRRVR